MTQQQQQQPMPMSGNFDTRLGVLESAVSSISAQLGDISKKLEARSSINWQPISILVAVLGTIGGMGFTWINTGQGRLELMIGKIEAKAERYVPREDLEPRFDAIKLAMVEQFKANVERRNDLQRLTDERIARVERDFEGVSRQVVPRAEHEQQWATQRARDEAVQRQIDGLRSAVTDLNTPRDTIQGILRRLDELDRASRSALRIAP